jgi:hypothetical protein
MRQDGRIRIEVVKANDGDRAVIRRLLQFFHYDLSDFDGTDVDVDGGEWLIP